MAPERLVHFQAPYYMTACGKDTANWKDRAFKTTNKLRDVTCAGCLKMLAADAIQRLNQLKGRTRDGAYLTDELEDVLEDPAIVVSTPS